MTKTYPNRRSQPLAGIAITFLVAAAFLGSWLAQGRAQTRQESMYDGPSRPTATVSATATPINSLLPDREKPVPHWTGPFR
jgi:hypothetical protein